MATVDEFFAKLPQGWRAHVGHTPFIGKRPKGLKDCPFEAYVVNDKVFGTPDYIFVSGDGKTPIEALTMAMNNAIQAAAVINTKKMRDKEKKK